MHDATCILCGRQHAAEQLDARGRCSGCLHELGTAKTLRPPPRGESAELNDYGPRLHGALA